METKIYNSQAEIDTSKLRAWVEKQLYNTYVST